MMLTRIADSLYWMGRYIERAENITRILRMTTEFSVELEGLNEPLAQEEWLTMLGPEPINDSGLGFKEKYIASFLYDDLNPSSVLFSLSQARNNARSIGEVLTREVFSQINETYHQLDAYREDKNLSSATLYDHVCETHSSLLTTIGAIEHTLNRDQGWTYMKLGEAMERTQRTLSVIELKLPALRKTALDTDSTLYYAMCRSLLLSLASLENYRRSYGAKLEPETALRFLLFDADSPRSVRTGVTRMKSYFDRIPSGNSGVLLARKILGRMQSELEYDEDSIMLLGDLSEYTHRTYHSLSKAHDALCHPTVEEDEPVGENGVVKEEAL